MGGPPPARLAGASPTLIASAGSGTHTRVTTEPFMTSPFRLALLAGLLAGGCGAVSSSAPADHTVNEEGVRHRQGLTNPTVNCVACHGAALTGDQGPSCTSCHQKRW